MSLIRFWTLPLTLAISLAAMVPATPADAVVGAQPDVSNSYPNVARLEIRSDGQLRGVCTATLVKKDVVITAAHCVAFTLALGLGIDAISVTFDPSPGPDSPRLPAVAAQMHPDFSVQPIANSKLVLGPGSEDVALVWLGQPVTDIAPAPVIAAGGLDTLDVTHETFTVGGYGISEFYTGSLASNRRQYVFGPRSYRDVSVITEHDAFPERYLKITASTCGGDSGGPLFHGRTVVALNTATLSMRCAAPSYSYRLDTPAAQAFLARGLG
jgi:Trypsin